MTTPKWKQDGDTIYSVSLAGFRVVVYAGASPCIWRMKYGLPPGDSKTLQLAATSAREAQEEALDIVWRWARGLVAAVEEMQGAKSNA